MDYFVYIVDKLLISLQVIHIPYSQILYTQHIIVNYKQQINNLGYSYPQVIHMKNYVNWW